MSLISTLEIKEKFVAAFNGSYSFSCGEGNPFGVKFRNREYNVFLRNLSPAYLSNPDITRVQLPFRKYFAKYSKQSFPFIILGYDAETDVFVCWDFQLIRQRLNKKNNVSLFSRKSFQKKTKKNTFKEEYLNNGDKLIVFARRTLPFFLKNTDRFFKKSNKIVAKKSEKDLEITASIHETGKLYEIKVKALRNKLKSLLKQNEILNAVEVCEKYYKKKYPKMSLKDWFELVESIATKP
jgi:hypothetical protein